MAAGPGSPCGACKFLRRKCASGCIFAPYFSSDQGPARFAAIHKVFGASNVSKLLLHLPVHDRCEAVVTIAYEAQARIRDPVYGCVAHIFALQQQVTYLQAQLMQAKAQLANNLVDNCNNIENQWSGASMHNNNYPSIQPPFQSQSCLTSSTTTIPIQNYINTPISPQSSLDSIDQQQGSHDHYGGVIQHKLEGIVGKKRSLNEMGELQELALRMMRN
ncbi:LOB domain-containing protein 16-like [Silene latifolia]|uniref:LOB domain-containing protein 16-like n=1 Tax=Silene latifolia TaxID=37657 RepID=UPI003D773B86